MVKALKVGSFILLAVLLAAAFASGWWGFEPKIPNGKAFGCDTCHKKSDFKKDLKNNDNKWDETLAALDSDRDGFANGVELLDPEGAWREGNDDPTVEGREATNPSDAKSFPPEEAEEEVEEAEAAPAGTAEDRVPPPGTAEE